MIHLVYANRSNAGDWLSARGIRLLLGDRPVTEHLCDEPFVASTLRALATAGPDDLVIVGGGGLLMDYFTPLWRGLAELTHLRLCLWGLGVVDLKAEPSLPPLPLLREVASRALVCRVRDQHTRELLAPLVLPEPVPCPSLVAVTPRPTTERGVLHVANLTTVGEPAYAAMRERAGAFAERTGRPFRETNNRLEADREDRLAAVLALYQRSDVVLSSRLHGCLFAIGMGRRVLAVSGDRKIESAMAAAGLGDWVLDAGDVDRVPRRLAELGDQPDPGAFRAAAIAANRAVAAEVREVLR